MSQCDCELGRVHTCEEFRSRMGRIGEHARTASVMADRLRQEADRAYAAYLAYVDYLRTMETQR